jgi:hypothetical protein
MVVGMSKAVCGGTEINNNHSKKKLWAKIFK